MTDIPHIDMPHEEAVALAAAEQAHLARCRVVARMKSAGVPQEQLLGHIADLAQLSMYCHARSVIALGVHGTQEQIAAVADLLPDAQALVSAYEAGALKIPAIEKGIETTQDEMIRTADAYIAAKS
ncbi:hypothetical protein [Roseibium sp. RKSG952]|uniref:hypothetical protein n=1 Tax=Roseibium sp. RKSG952 TaxID=2529384 RepID=UPI0012BC201E|nr:hypothetical protein [Roseibium sp. RKSG952]MTH94727.1 hypothetical protein [Roseibium sp. RKSG952]